MGMFKSFNPVKKKLPAENCRVYGQWNGAWYTLTAAQARTRIGFLEIIENPGVVTFICNLNVPIKGGRQRQEN